MRILWIKTELLHPVDKGGKIRTYQMLRALRKRHDITYLCLDDGTAVSDAIALSREYAHRTVTVPFSPPPKGSPRFAAALLGNLLSSLPYAVSRYKSPALSQQIRHLSVGMDLVVCDFLAPAINVPPSLPLRTVLFQHNVEAMIWLRHASVPQNAIRRAYMSEQWRRMVAFEKTACRRFAHVVAVSDLDAEVFRKDYGVHSVSTVATGVDLEYFSPPVQRERSGREIVFVGSMDWLPNDDGMRWFLGDVLPELRQRLPDARLSIVGRSPSDSLRRLAKQVGGVEVTGPVPDVRPYLARAALSIVPLRIGGGTRLKIYEAMAMGTPVVSTSIGAEGLPLEPGRQISIADDSLSLARAVEHALTDHARADAMADAALDFVRQHCSWNAVANQFMKNCMEH